jgi:hypothetical protein
VHVACHRLQAIERWIGCDLLRSQTGFGWGYKDLDESMFPYFFSCPLKYLDLVPIEKFGGNAEWRATVRRYHQRQAEKRRSRFTHTGGRESTVRRLDHRR